MSATPPAAEAPRPAEVAGLPGERKAASSGTLFEIYASIVRNTKTIHVIG